MDGLKVPPQQEATAQLSAQLTPQMVRESLGTDVCGLIANSLRFLGMHAQIRRDPGARKFYDDMARFFQGK